MQRIDNSGAVASLPAPLAAGTPGYFGRGNPSLGQLATPLSADWANMVQEELMAVVLAAGLTPDKENMGQLLEALLGGGLFPTQVLTDSSQKVSTTEFVQLLFAMRAGSAGAISGDRNRVINGSCQIVNVASVAVGNGVQNAHAGPELFPASNTGGGQFTQSQGSLTWEGLTLPTVRQTVNTANTDLSGTNQWLGISHRFEGFNVFDLRGKPVALSFVFNANVSGTFSVSVRDNGATQSYVSTFAAVANTPVKVTIPVAAIPLAANVPNSNATGLSVSVGFLNTGTHQTATLNAWQAGNFAAASGATNWGAGIGNFIELTNLQLEEGAVSTPFIRRSYQQELALTQRYAFRLDQARDGSRQIAVGSFRGSATVADLIGNMPVSMRAQPTLITSAPSTFNLYSTAGAPAPTAFSVSTDATRTTFTLSATSPTAVTQGSGAFLALNTGAFIELSARL